MKQLHTPGEIGLWLATPKWSHFPIEAIPDAPNGIDAVAQCAQLAAQSSDVIVYRAVESLIVTTPDLLNDDRALEDPAGMRRQQDKQIVLFGRQFRRLSIHADRALGEINGEPPNNQRLRRR